MTSPSVDLDSIMPYGLNVSANTSSTYIHPDGDSSRIDGSFILLPVGPCQVQFTWPGKQDAYVRWVDSSINEKGIPIEISGGVFPKDRYHRRSPRRQTTGAHPLQRQSWHDRNYHGVPHAPITMGVVKHDHPKHRPGLEAMLPKAVVLQPAWNDMTARVMNSYREETSDPTHRFIIPKGISVILVENSSRFTVTLKILRGLPK